MLSQKQKNKHEVIEILKTLLKQSNSKGLSSSVDLMDITWLEWTIVNGTAQEVAILIESRLPPDPLTGMS